MKNIVLLKNETTPIDPYMEAMNQNGMNPIFIPLLTHTHINHALIIDFLTSAEFLNEYKALIITSQRCIESLDIILKTLKNSGFDQMDKVLNKPAYTVGPATFSVLSNLGFTDIRGGSNAGNGSILADLMINDPLFAVSAPEHRKVLFLTGEIRKDIVPRKLLANGFGLKELVAYRTEDREDIVERYMNINESLFSGPSHDEENWIVFFSPQGTERIVEHILEGDIAFKIAVIGPTTNEYLLGKGLKPHVVCKKPTAASLVEEINSLKMYKNLM